MTLAARPSSSPTHQTVSRAILAEAAERAIGLGIADRHHDGSITFVQRDDSGGPAASEPAGVPATTPEPTPATTAPATTVEPAASGPAPVPAAGGADLDELAHKLYDRIRWRLRTELRLDMERAGRSTVSRR